MLEVIRKPAESDLSVSRRERFLVQLSERGIKGDSVAWRGTSLETIQILLTTGIIPSYTGERTTTSGIQKGDIFIIPDGKKFPFNKVQNANPHYINHLETRAAANSIKIAREYAEDVAWRHCFFKNLDLPLNKGIDLDGFFLDIQLHKLPLEACEDYDVALNLAGSREILDKVVAETVKRKGIVIGLLPKTFDTFPVFHGDIDDDLRINAKGGLKIEFLGGIKALGKVEKKFIENLKNKNVKQGV